MFGKAISLFILLCISTLWSDEIIEEFNHCRKYKWAKAAILFFTGLVAFILSHHFGSTFSWYFKWSIVFLIGEILSIISPNLRDIYTGLCSSVLIAILSLNNLDGVWKYVCLTLAMLLVLSTFESGVSNIIHHINPDEIAYDEKHKFKFPIFKTIKTGLFLMRIFK